MATRRRASARGASGPAGARRAITPSPPCLNPTRPPPPTPPVAGAAPPPPAPPTPTTCPTRSVSPRPPPQYRLNKERFLRVVRLVPLRDGAAQVPAGGKETKSYSLRLAEDLLDPNRTVTAALRLEALGQRSIPALKPGLTSSHPLVRFCSAEALAYLGSPSCADELGRCAVESPLFRSLALMALASLDEAVCHVKLKEILHQCDDDQVRCGAFRALHLLNPNDPLVKGELLNDSFRVHRLAPQGPGLVHLATSKRAEVLLLGQTPTLKGPFSFLAGEFTVTAGDGDGHCTISRVPAGGRPARKTCSLVVEDMLRTLAELGGTYAEAVTLLQQAHECRCLSCRVRVDALP